MASRNVPDAEWDIVRAAFEAGRETVAAIAERHGLHSLAIYGRAHRSGWIDPRRETRTAASAPAEIDAIALQGAPSATPAKRKSTAKRKVVKRKRAASSEKVAVTADRAPSGETASGKTRLTRPSEPGVERGALIARLFNLIALRLDRMEKEMTSDDPANRSDSERETRAIGTIAQSIERLTELETDRTRGTKQRDGDKHAPTGPLGPEETQRLSIALAERLEKLARRTRRD